MDEQAEKPELEIKSDESWKERVKAEDAKLDAERGGGTEPPTPEPRPEPEPAAAAAGASSSAADAEPDIEPSQIPPASFEVLVHSFSTQALVALGLIPHPTTGAPKPQPALAKHFIDLLAVIEEKTQGNLSNPERNLLVDSLHHLRMAYVELSKNMD